MPVGNVKRIGFVGVHSAGKDTLTHHAFTYLKLKKKTAYYISEVAEQALMRKIDLQSPAGDLWVLSEQMRHECEVIASQMREYVICNRTIIDVLPYAHYFVNEWFAARLSNIVLNYLRTFNYDLVIWLKPLPEIEDDGVRYTDRDQQKAIDELFAKYLRTMRIATHFDFVEISDNNKPDRIRTLETILDTWLAFHAEPKNKGRNCFA